MEVRINNQTHQVSEGISLQGLFSEIGFQEVRGIAVALNDQVIPKDQWESYLLQTNDSITIIRATQGG